MEKSVLSNHVYKEMVYHDKLSPLYIKRSKTDLIWQIPEKIIFNKYIDINKNWTFLDIGCGSAENIKKNILPLMIKNSSYIGVDISKNLLKKAIQNIPSGTFIQKPMQKLQIKEGTIDYLSFFGSLHHDEYPEKTLKKVCKFLRPGGLIFMREPQEKAFKKGYGASPCEAGINPIHLKKYLEDSNIDILEWHYLNSILFHFIRRVLRKLKLDKWESIELFWTIKTKIELLFEKLFIGPLKNLQGTDMFIVARRKI